LLQAIFLTLCHPTFYVLPLSLQVFLETESVVVAELSPEIFVLAFVATGLSPEVVSPAGEPEAVVSVVESEVVSVAGLSPEVAVLAVEPEAVVSVVESEVVFVAELSPEVAVLAVEPEVVFVAAEPQASVDIAVAFVVLIPVSVVVAEVDSSGRPMFPAFPSVYYFASPASFVEDVGEESVHSPTGARTNFGLYSILSNLDLHQNRKWEHSYNNPSPGCNNASDTNVRPIDATTSHSRKRGLHQCREQRRHMYRVSLLTLAVQEIK
jgi:hypothetical protein